jgi:hypothetical protein
MEVMLAYDNSRNAQIALDGMMALFAHAKPNVTLISVHPLVQQMRCLIRNTKLAKPGLRPQRQS